MRSRKNYADWSYQARTNRVKIVGCPNAENRSEKSLLFEDVLLILHSEKHLLIGDVHDLD